MIMGAVVPGRDHAGAAAGGIQDGWGWVFANLRSQAFAGVRRDAIAVRDEEMRLPSACIPHYAQRRGTRRLRPVFGLIGWSG